MLARRIIPCLDCDLGVPGGRVVKGIEFKQIRYAGVPWELADQYYQDGADEIVFLDITASSDRRETMTSVIKKTSLSVFVPLAVGGGISSLAQSREVFNAGADKVTLNTSALKRPDLISEIAGRYGNQAVVLAIDAKRRYSQEDGRNMVQTEEGPCWFECSYYGGREFTGIDAIAWAKKAVSLGAGEILLTSMDRDGTKIGFNLALTRAVSEALDIPVIASGGVGNVQHLVEGVKEGKADAVLAASIFHFGEVRISEAKAAMRAAGIEVRL